MYETEIRRGMALLTDKEIHSVNLRTLNMLKWDRCVLGQLFGHYYYGLHALIDTQRIPAGEDLRGYGFLVPFPIGGSLSMGADELHARYQILTHEWKLALKAERAKRGGRTNV
jgi:hypothetical protein